MKEKMNEEMSWKEILTQLGMGAAWGTVFLLFVCCSDGFFRWMFGQ